MATLLLTVVGSVIGGPLGGALGALLGSQVDAVVAGGRKVEGPRLKELTVQTSSYGTAIPLHFGRMRAAGSVIWSTELTETKEKSGGKGRPSVTTYAYSASFAVALASRPIAGIGRIWADGNLLRGTEGDLKVAGSMRVYTGHGDQMQDMLIVQAEGTTRCPAHRGCAYVVFEDLALADYGNRLPSLTFEILADAGDTTVGAIAQSILPEAEVRDLNQVLAGFSIDQGSVGDTLATIADAVPISCSSMGDRLVLQAAEAAPGGSFPLMPLPARSEDAQAEKAKTTGWSRKREPLPRVKQSALRYYDIARDYQPGLQRGIGRNEYGELQVIELPAALTADTARSIASSAGRRAARPSDTISYRLTEIDPGFGPGAIVRLPVASGLWQITQWEWQKDGLSLELSACSARVGASSAPAADAGRFNQAADLAGTPTVLAAFELPWDGTGSGNSAIIYAAASAASAGWTGASLFADPGGDGGTLAALGGTGRKRALLGRAIGVLAPASPFLIDNASTLDIKLAGADLALLNATMAQLLQGGNRAKVGSEVIQFAYATPLGAGNWRLSGLLRGRAGTEWAVSNHIADEVFVMIDEALVRLDSQTIGEASDARIVAAGLGDAAAVSVPIGERGKTLEPLSPVKGHASRRADGSIALSWVRRARGAWLWTDAVDSPLNEESEAWEVGFGDANQPSLRWQTASAALILTPSLVAALPQGVSQIFNVRQIGRAGASRALAIAVPA
jgi:hypothetical protein